MDASQFRIYSTTLQSHHAYNAENAHSFHLIALFRRFYQFHVGNKRKKKGPVWNRQRGTKREKREAKIGTQQFRIKNENPIGMLIAYIHSYVPHFGMYNLKKKKHKNVEKKKLKKNYTTKDDANECDCGMNATAAQILSWLYVYCSLAFDVDTWMPIVISYLFNISQVPNEMIAMTIPKSRYRMPCASDPLQLFFHFFLFLSRRTHKY